MSLQPHFWFRDFIDRVLDKSLAWQINSLEWDVIGGCSQASLAVNGPELALWNLVEFLRCPVEIQDERADLAWWGLVNEVHLQLEGLDVGVSLDSMFNRVAVAYSYIEPGSNSVGQRKTTNWAQDDDSVAEYGTREWLDSASGLPDAAAAARRDAQLALHKYPQGVASPIGGGSGKEVSAVLSCRGWLDTLGWQYGSVPSVVGPSYVTAAAQEQAFGNAAGTTKVFQQILVGAQAINLLSIRVYARKQAAPVDNFTVGIYAPLCVLTLQNRDEL